MQQTPNAELGFPQDVSAIQVSLLYCINPELLLLTVSVSTVYIYGAHIPLLKW